MKFTFSLRVFLPLLVLCFSLSSCFDFKEEITIHSDGSGSFRQIIDMDSSPMMRLLKEFEESDSSKSEQANSSIMAKMDSAMQESKKRLANIKGISNVVVRTDEENFKVDISYDFANIDALNKAISLEEDRQKKFYSFRKGQLQRLNTLNLGDNELLGSFDGNTSEEAADKETKQAQKLIQMMFADLNYELIIHVPKKIKSYTNKENAFLSEDKKTLHVKIPLSELFDKTAKKSLATKVKFK